MSFYAAAVFIVLASIPIRVSAIKCYACTTGHAATSRADIEVRLVDKGCGEPFHVVPAMEKECKPDATKCGLIKYKGNTVDRVCVNKAMTCDNLKEPGVVDCALCEVDLCNGTPASSSASSLIWPPLGVLLIFLAMLQLWALMRASAIADQLLEDLSRLKG